MQYHITLTNTRKLALSGLVAGLYVLIMVATQGFAFAQYQIRLATCLYALSGIYPFLVIPLALGNMVSNLLLGGMGLADMLGGFIVGLLTAGSIVLIVKYRLHEWLIAGVIVLIPGLVVPIWLSYILVLPYASLAILLVIGQIIPGLFGLLLFRRLRAILCLRARR